MVGVGRDLKIICWISWVNFYVHCICSLGSLILARWFVFCGFFLLFYILVHYWLNSFQIKMIWSISYLFKISFDTKQSRMCFCAQAYFVGKDFCLDWLGLFVCWGIFCSFSTVFDFSFSSTFGIFLETGSEELVFLVYKLERNPKFFQATCIKILQTKRLGRAWEDRDHTKPCTYCSAPGSESKFWCFEFLWTKSRCLQSGVLLLKSSSCD